MSCKEQLSSILEAFEKRGIRTHLSDDRKGALTKCLEFVEGHETVALGGSSTLAEIGLPESLEKAGVDVFKRPPRDSSPDFRYMEMRKSLMVDVMYSSANAVTRDGRILNIDGYGNRVSSHIFGPKRVVIVVGYNKITGTLAEAYYRVKNIASPPNVRRLETGAPCGENDYCTDCLGHPGRICGYVVEFQNVRFRDRVHLIMVNERLGF